MVFFLIDLSLLMELFLLQSKGLEAFCKQYLKAYHKELFSNKAPKAIGRVLAEYDGYLLRLCNAVILKYIGITNKNLDCSK